MKSVLEIDKWLYNLPTDYQLITLTSSISGKPCRDQFNLEIKRWSSNLKVLTLNIEIKRSLLIRLSTEKFWPIRDFKKK